MKFGTKSFCNRNRLSCSTESNTKPPQLTALPSHLSFDRKVFWDTWNSGIWGLRWKHKRDRAFFSAFEASLKQQPLRNILSLICFSVHDNLPLQTWDIFQRLNKSEFNPGTEVKEQGPDAKGYKRTQKRPKNIPNMTQTQLISTAALHWSRARTNTAEATARTENKRNVVCGKYPGKLNRNKYSTVKRYICFVNLTRVRKSNGCFHGFKSMLNTISINTFSEHTGSSVCYF